MKGISTFFPLMLMALLAILTFWLQRATSIEDSSRGASKRHDPDFIIDRFNLRHFDSGGSLKQSLLAQKLSHFPDNDSADINGPELTYYAGQRRTLLFAKTAQVSHDNKQVDLAGNVRLVRPATQEDTKMVLETETLTVFPDDDIAQSNSRVTITRGQSIVSGNSIHYNGRDNIAVLSGNVRGIFYRTR